MKYSDIVVANQAMIEQARHADELSAALLDKADTFEELARQIRSQAKGQQALAESLRRMAADDFMPAPNADLREIAKRGAPMQDAA